MEVACPEPMSAAATWRRLVVGGERVVSEKILGDRRAALEDAFFAKRDAELMRRLHHLRQAGLAKEELAAASGITDDALLEKIIALGIDGSTLAALAVVPLVAVAWADGPIQDEERRQAFRRAAEMGLGEQDVSHRLFERWLAEPPPDALLTAWKGYIKALAETRGEDARGALRREVMRHARAVGAAAGGFLGLGSKVSPAEERVLAELERAFSD